MKKDLLKLLDLSTEEIIEILDVADQLKDMKKKGSMKKRLLRQKKPWKSSR